MKFLDLMRGLGAFAALAALAQPAHAAGTAAGTDVINQATISYSVAGTPQGPVLSDDPTSTDTGNQRPTKFKVDRIIAHTVAEVGDTATVGESPSTNKVTTFTLTNTSNATLDFNIGVVQFTGGAAAFLSSGNDTFDVDTVRIYEDNSAGAPGTIGVWDAGDRQLTTGTIGVDALAADASKTLFIVANIPVDKIGAARVALTATARENDNSANTLGISISTENVANTALGVETVFNDAAGPATGDGARDGVASDDDDYIAQPLPKLSKTGTVISDPINNTTNPKAIPGAVIEYCVRVQNTGPLDITNVTVADQIPTNTTYVPASIVTGGTTSDGNATAASNCNNDGTALNAAGDTLTSGTGLDNGTTPPTVKWNVGTRATNSAATTLRFRVKVN